MSSYSKITLFRNTKFYPNQNYKIDDIEAFLNSYLSNDKKVFDNQQYWKINGIIKEFKLDISQANIKNIHEFNYAKVEMITGDEVEFVEWKLYYFVVNFEWLSRSTIKLTLRLDTLNTFLDTLQFHPKTFIEREHCDRWNFTDGAYIKDETNQEITLLREIPELNEGLNPQKYSYTFNDFTNFNFSLCMRLQDYLLIKANNNDFSWIANYLTNSDRDYQDDSPLIFVLNITYGYMYIKHDYFGGEIFIMSPSINIDRTSNDNQKILILPYAPHEELLDVTQYTQANPFIRTTDEVLNGIHYKYNYDDVDIYLDGIKYAPRKKWNEDSPRIRISRHISKGGSTINFDRIFIKLFTHKINYSSLLSNIVDNGYFKALNYSNESAMFNSEFFQIQFSYMDNSYSISMEDFKYNGNKSLEELLDYENNPNGFISINYSYSILIDNSIYFEFGTNQNSFDINYKENGHLMIVPLTSQIPIMNNEYLNYMRNGFNYDIKIRDAGREYRERMRGLENISAPWKFLTMNPTKIIGRIVPTIAEFGGKNFTEEYTQLTENLQMEKNIAQLKGSKIGIEQINGGIDKINHTTIDYKLSFTIMISRKSWWKYLDDYFYYFGNKVQYYGIPTHHNRCLFDYLKCKAEFVNRNSLPTQEALADITNRLNAGVVFIHKFMNQWTFDSDYKENIEVSLYNIINPTKKKKNKRS